MTQTNNFTPDEWQLVAKSLYTLNTLELDDRDLSREEQKAAFDLAERISAHVRAS